MDMNYEEIEQSIPEHVERIVERYSERIAFKNKHIVLTWDALNREANRFARAILDVPGPRETPVALFLNQGASILTAILGILKAGRFYVPLDPSHPRERNRYILADTEASLVVTNGRTLSLAGELTPTDGELINIDEVDQNLSDDNLGLRISPDSLVNIVYTSGSTGQPKGVMHTQRTYMHRTRHGVQLQLSSDDRITAAGTAGRDVFFGLVNGVGSFPWNVKEEGVDHLSEWLNRENITVYRSVPSVFRQFASSLTGDEEFPKLRLVVLTGEPVYRTDIDLFKRHFSAQCCLVNSLGTTETGTFRHYIIPHGRNITSEIVPVGYPVEGKDVFLVDDDGKIVGFNKIGEIAVKSRYLSLGYWRRPELTREKFLPDPSGNVERIYFTGDLGLMLPDGCLEHRGRRDFQVKIRGNRIELAEVENVLRRMKEIRDIVVVAREDTPGEKRIVAYIVPAASGGVSVSEMRKFVQKELPSFMAPASFVIVNALPLTPNGKIDRRALPDPGKCRPELETPFVAATTAVEKALETIWAVVLSLDQVGLHDNFFDLGGHSLAATRVVAQVIRTFKLEIPLQSLFQSPTVAEMAAVIAENQAKKLGAQELEGILSELESLSDEDAKKLLANQSVLPIGDDKHE